MQIYQCPNCGRTYSEFQNVYYCVNCNYKLVNQKNIKEVKHPELSNHDSHIIGMVNDSTKHQVECPYCNSTNTSKITNTSKAIHTVMFGIFSMGRNSKNFHCNNCSADF